MDRYIFLFLPLLLLCSITAQIQAASIPVLDGGNAKKRPQAATAHKPSSQPSVPVVVKKRSISTASKNIPDIAETVVTLGRPGDISAIKQKMKRSAASQVMNIGEDDGKVSCAPASLPYISKQITSKSVIILDAHSGKTLFSKAPDNPRQPASTIKVLTGMIAMKRLKNNEKVEISQHAEAMPSSKVYLSTKKQYRANDLINAVLLSSANDASVALAEKIAGSESAFAKLMTLHASLWGAKNTICRTASGLTASGQQSTARDLAQIFRHAMQDNEFAERMKLTRIRTSFGKTLYNHNKALWQVEGAMAGKTGYTDLARQTYVGQFERGDAAIVVAIMGSETMWRDIKRLVDYGFRKKEQIRLAQIDQGATHVQ